MSKKIIVIVICTILCIAGATVLVYGISQYFINKTNDTGVIIPEVINEGRPAEEILEEDYNNNKPGLIEQTNSSDINQKAEAYKELAYAALNTKRYDEALEYAKQREALTPTDVSAALIAKIGYDKGDYALSVQYYDIAMSRVPKTEDPSLNTMYNRYLAYKTQAEQKQ